MSLVAKVKRAIRKPPRVIVKRLGQEVSAYAERYVAPQRIRRFTLMRLLKKTEQQTLQQLWLFLSQRPYVSYTQVMDASYFEALFPGESALIFTRAEHAMAHRVDLLGSGLIELGACIDWHKDYKTQHAWPRDYMRDIDYNNLDRPSDVKFPWELSRMQWLIPVGQAYLLTQDERYAEKIKALLLDWMENNPYACGINWACTMDVALRLVSWTWFFHVFKASQAWQDEVFQQKFLTCLYLHADFTERHLEFSDINGNHYTADAAGLVFAGLFFGGGEDALRWQRKGWDILCQELPRQVFEDGVDFEASVPYHRLVLELFFLPACYREALKLKTPEHYKERLVRMAEFSVAYTQPDGGVPYWGDADDARALPFGNQAINDHRYLSALLGYTWNIPALLAHKAGAFAEHFWMHGSAVVERIQQEQQHKLPTSCAFPQGGFYIMQNADDHIFIDCGPLGLAGRGGHGHNDCLSFEAVLNGVKLISDCGAYVYTASYHDRNLFRSTAYHNTPCIDNQEINRFIQWDYLWNLHHDAKPRVDAWKPGSKQDYFCGMHTGYQRLASSVIPKRTITLEHQTHRLMIQDDILCDGPHEVTIPLHLAVNVTATLSDDKMSILLQASEKQFTLTWEGDAAWELQMTSSRVSPSYGVVYPTQKLLWQASIVGDSQLNIVLSPF
jgi:uncharacterized heparinase superfamily protein